MDGRFSWSFQDASPAHSKLNAMLVQENIEKHITMVAGILNLQTHEITWSSAGHYPPQLSLNLIKHLKFLQPVVSLWDSRRI